MSVGEVSLGECVHWQGSRTQNRTLQDASTKGPKIVEATKVTEKEQPGEGMENKKSHVLEAKGREFQEGSSGQKCLMLQRSQKVRTKLCLLDLKPRR